MAEIIHVPFTPLTVDPPVDYYLCKVWKDAVRDDGLDTMAAATATEATVTVEPGHSYTFRICAVRDAIEGPDSNPVTIIVDDGALTAPNVGTPYVE